MHAVAGFITFASIAVVGVPTVLPILLFLVISAVAYVHTVVGCHAIAVILVVACFW